jgi:hypothetical protein
MARVAAKRERSSVRPAYLTVCVVDSDGRVDVASTVLTNPGLSLD